jgi:hypothetical protein
MCGCHYSHRAQEVLRKDEEIKRLNQRYVPERSETEKQTS